MPSNFLILYRPLLPLPSVFPSIRVWCWSCNTLATQGEELICYYITDRYNMFCISTHLLTDIWAISTFQLSGIVLLWVFLHLNGWRGNSLAVQQLVLSTFTAGGRGFKTERGTKIPQAVWYSQKVKQWLKKIKTRTIFHDMWKISVHGISQARILEWVAISSSRGSSWPRDGTCNSCITGGLFTSWTTREA